MNNAVVIVYKSHVEAEAAVTQLLQTEINPKKLSIIGYDFYSDEELAGVDNASNDTKPSGKDGAFWSGIWVSLGAAFLFVPCFGPLLVAGPLISRIVEALKGGVVLNGLSALGTGLHSLGIPEDSISRYETLLKAGMFVIVAQGSAKDVPQMQRFADHTNPESLKVHPLAHAIPEPCLMGV
jgi:hypothetical protein